MIKFTIRSLGFEPQQLTSMIAVLDIANSALNSVWSFVDQEASDVIMINIDNDVGLEIYSEHKYNPNSIIILVAEKNGRDKSDQWFLAQKKQKPPSLRELVQLLNQIEVNLLETIANAPSEKPGPQTEKNIKNYKKPSLEEMKYAEMNLDLDQDWLKMLDTEKW